MAAKRQYFKLSEDDVLGIVSDYLSTQVDFDTFNSKISFIDNEEQQYRMIAVYGELEDDEIDTVDFEKLDKELDFNGERSLNKSGFDRNSPEIKNMIAKWEHLLDENK